MEGALIRGEKGHLMEGEGVPLTSKRGTSQNLNRGNYLR